MAITNFAGLLEALQKWTVRSDSTFANRVPDFIAMAEDRICHGADIRGGALYSPALRSVNLETTGTITLYDGVGSLPPRYLGARSLTRDTDKVGLDYLPLDRFFAESAKNSGGLPGFYTVQDGMLRVTPAFTGDLEITYYALPEALSVDAPVNSLIAAHPMIYLEACLFEAFSWMQDPDLAMAHLGRLRAMIEGLNRTGATRQISGANLRIQPRRYIP